MVDQIRIGNVDILGLPDASLDPSPWPFTMRFPDTPLDALAPFRARYPGAFSTVGTAADSPTNFTCYVLRSAGRTVLVDTGIGPSSAPLAGGIGHAGDLPEKLRAQGLQPDEIDFVVLTHLHPDHIGWNVQAVDGVSRPTFSRARYVVHRADWEAWQTPEVQAIFAGFDTHVKPLYDLGVLDVVDGERSITPELTTLHTPGHTPGSQSVLVQSDGQRALIVGDAFSHPVQVTEPGWRYVFDMHADVAARTRHTLLDRLDAESMPFAASHFPVPGFGKVVSIASRRYWQAL
jgi:glyoxylase-like metal-dependent hydrolase (beta-lactamase superfamily II)